MPRRMLWVAALVMGCGFGAAWAVADEPPAVPQAAPPVPQPWQAVHGAQMRMQLQQRLLQQRVRKQVIGFDGDVEAGEGYAFREDRETLTILRKAGELVEQKRFAEAVEALGRLLESGEDHFIKPGPGEKIYRSAKTKARQALADLPPEGRDSYELQFGASARQSLDEAVARGDIEGVAEVARRFYHTKAGYEATFLLGLHHLDHGRSLAAAHVWRPLIDLNDARRSDFEPLLGVLFARALWESGREDEAKQQVIAVRQRHGGVGLRLAGEALPWFEQDDQALDWLRKLSSTARAATTPSDWTQFRGDPARNVASDGGTPLLAYRWRVPTANDDPAVERAVEQMHRTYRDENLTTLPGLHPLAVGNTILMRSARNLLAIDFATGKRLWEVPTDNPFESLPTSASRGYGQDSSQALFELLERRLWDDAVYGTLSSDGELVFAVEPAESDGSAYTGRFLVGGNQGMQFQQFFGGAGQTNRLTALDIATGKLKWEIGGPKGNFPLEQAGAFFLGPPLPLFGRLYVLAEIEGEMRLLALNSMTGSLLWSQQIAVGAQEFLNDQVPHLSGAMPSYADGVLVCPTSAGAVVAVDLSTRSLLWGVQYPRQLEPWMYGQTRNALIQMNLFPGSRDAESQLRWSDSTATIADGRVLLTCPDSDRVVCHDLLTGVKHWEAPHEDGLYIGCVEEGRVLLVGATKLRSLDLLDGRDLWAPHGVQLPAGARPSGRGFVSEGVYYLPTSQGEVLGIHITDGKIASVARPMTSVRGARAERSPLGNLICHRGSVLSHSVEWLECFDQLETLAERTAAILAATPDDPQALMRMGEIQLQKQDYAAAMSSLRRAWDLDADESTRKLLVDAYLTVLEQDFASLRDQLADVESVIGSLDERSAYLRLKAAGLESVGDRVAAFVAYQELAALSDAWAEEELEPVKPHWEVRRERLVRAHLERIHKAAVEADDQPALDKMQQVVNEAWRRSEADATRENLERFVAFYGGFAAADEARFRLADVRAASGEWLAAELLLMDLERNSNAEVARRAWARHAQLLADAGRPDDAAVYYQRLVGEWADQLCGAERTGRQWFEALPAGHAVREALSGRPTFPTGVVKVNELSQEFDPSGARTPVDVEGLRGPFYRSLSLFVSQSAQRNSVSADDGLGNRLWNLPLQDPSHPELPIIAPNAGLSQGRVHGHLAVVSYGYHLFAIDPLGSRQSNGPRLLWRADLGDAVPGMGRSQGIIQQQATQRFAPPKFYAADQFNRRIGNTACLGEIGLVYQRGRVLCCVSPVTGKLQWTRDDIPPGADLFGDGEVLCVIPPGQDALVLDAVDGNDLGRRKAPPPDQRVQTLGRCVLSWTDLGAKGELRYQDLWEDRQVWSAEFPVRAKAWLVDGESIGVFEPEGRFVLLNIADGKKLIDAQLDAERKISEVYVFPSRDQYNLLVTHTVDRRRRSLISPVSGSYNNPAAIVNGKLYGFDRATGRKLWDKPYEIENQGMLLKQPTELPVLMFLCQNNENGRPGRKQANLLCIDKRTGRAAYNESFPISDTLVGMKMTGDAAKRSVTVSTVGKTVELQFTDEPVAPEPPDAAGDLQANKRRRNGAAFIFSALKALGQASQELSTPFGDPGEQDEAVDDAVEAVWEEAAEGEELPFEEMPELEEALPIPPFDDVFEEEAPNSPAEEAP